MPDVTTPAAELMEVKRSAAQMGVEAPGAASGDDWAEGEPDDVDSRMGCEGRERVGLAIRLDSDEHPSRLPRPGSRDIMETLCS
jgi:hypothetical protein